MTIREQLLKILAEMNDASSYTANFRSEEMDGYEEACMRLEEIIERDYSDTGSN